MHRLVLWNIDLTLLDVGRVTRDAYAEAFRAVTGRWLAQLPAMTGRTESEIFFEAVALNEPVPRGPAAPGEELLASFTRELTQAFRARRDLLTSRGRLLPGAREAVAEVGRLPGVAQTVLTGSIKANAVEKLRAFGLAEHLDTEIGGYGSEPYPKGAMLLMTRGRAGDKHGCVYGEDATVYIADSTRDVEAARVGGARCLAVASGRSSAGELTAAGADAVLGDLTDAAVVAQTVDRLTAAVPR